MSVSISRPRRQLFLAAVGLVSLLGLSACGGGGGDSGEQLSWATVSGSTAVTALQSTDTTVGTGTATAATGNAVTVKYTVWLYDVRVNGTHKGTQIDTGTYPFTIGSSGTISGFSAGVTGMKVGGKRTVVVPASMGYGSAGKGSVPPDAALVFDLELVSIS